MAKLEPNWDSAIQLAIAKDALETFGIKRVSKTSCDWWVFYRTLHYRILWLS